MCVCVCVCHIEKKVSDKWQARQGTHMIHVTGIEAKKKKKKSKK